MERLWRGRLAGDFADHAPMPLVRRRTRKFNARRIEPKVGLVASLDKLMLAHSAANRWLANDVLELIDCTIRLFHRPHRGLLEEIQLLTQMLNQSQGKPSAAVEGILRLLEDLSKTLAATMARDETFLFPILLHGFGPSFAMLMQEIELVHATYRYSLEKLRRLVCELSFPEDVTPRWHDLYTPLQAVLEDLVQEIHTQSNHLSIHVLNHNRNC